MTALTWDGTGDKVFETGVDHGVLYMPDVSGDYTDGVPWNGLINVTESPSGAEASPFYADNIKYANILSAEQFGGTIEAYTYPPEFDQYNGISTPTPGVMITQQNRGIFGFSYRTLIGNDVDGVDHGYKLHLVYTAQASPSERANSTINESPEPIAMSWEFTTTGVPTPGGLKPTAHLIIDSREVGEDELTALELIMYGSVGVDPRLPLPSEVVTLMGTGATSATPTEPAFNSLTETITIPTVTGVQYLIDGEVVPAGDIVITADTIVTAEPVAGYYFPPGTDDDWFYDYTP